MAWKYYNFEENGQQLHSLDQVAQNLVLAAKERLVKDDRGRIVLDDNGQGKHSLNQSFKMREAVAYGLERFWGEHLRFQGKSKFNCDEFDNKSKYWKDTWDALVIIMRQGGVIIPNDSVHIDRPNSVKSMAQKLWALDIKDQRIILAVLTQLCDSIVWWTQRYKGPGDLTIDEDN